MVHTTEIRWFVAGVLPETVVEWFWHGGRPRPADEREDRYLLLPGCEQVGVKLRHGTAFDVKARLETGVTRTYASSIEGTLERWMKWSCGDARVVAGLGAVSGAGAEWLPVRKQRRLREFSLDSGAPAELTAYEKKRVGCHVELTFVRVRTVLAWSLGLEAYGEPTHLETALDSTAATFFAARPPPPVRLGAMASASYPSWLMRLTASGALEFGS